MASIELLAGSTFHEHYQVVRCLRAGGMGAVYEVLHGPTQRRRALKTVLPEWVTDPEMRARFHLEATVTADVESEHIVQVLDAGVDEPTGLPFLVMELLKGESLAELVARRGALPAREVVGLLRQASRGLERAHAAGIVHRDLKPENLFVTPRDDGSERLVLLDFGIAKLVAQGSQAATTRSLGTPLYMSPEHVRGDGDIGPAADVYSLGQLAFTLLAGEAYYQAESRDQSSVYGLLLKIMAGPAEPASERAKRLGAPLPPAFDAWFRQATALEAWQRFPGCSELVAALAQTLGVVEASGSSTNVAVALRRASLPAPRAPGSARRRRSSRFWLVLAAGCALAFSALLLRALATSRAPSPPGAPVTAAASPSVARAASLPAPAALPAEPVGRPSSVAAPPVAAPSLGSRSMAAVAEHKPLLAPPLAAASLAAPARPPALAPSVPLPDNPSRL
ncbi:MAG TPA: serine/threonine-protein kinase [Polyangiaceae bacterium]|jgi:serine/threonine-protein kinase